MVGIASVVAESSCPTIVGAEKRQVGAMAGRGLNGGAGGDGTVVVIAGGDAVDGVEDGRAVDLVEGVSSINGHKGDGVSRQSGCCRLRRCLPNLVQLCLQPRLRIRCSALCLPLRMLLQFVWR